MDVKLEASLPEVAKFLCKKYDTVIIPVFETQKMAKKRDNNGNWKRKINKETTRSEAWPSGIFKSLMDA